MKPIISPWLIYFASIADSLKIFCWMYFSMLHNCDMYSIHGGCINS